MNDEIVMPRKVTKIIISERLGLELSSEAIGESITLNIYDSFEEVSIRV